MRPSEQRHDDLNTQEEKNRRFLPVCASCLRIVYPLTALLPAIWVLAHPTPVAWLRPISKDTWPVGVACAIAAALPALLRRMEGRALSLAVIALTQAVFQAWSYNTASHPASYALQLWGAFPFSDAQMYYSAACELLNAQQITVMEGARHPFPVLLAVLLKILAHDFRLVTSTLTIVMALATWSAFEVIRLRLGGLTATVYLICVTLYVRIHCSGLFMTEQLGVLYSLCAVSLLVESVARQGKARAWLYFCGLFFLTQALNARPAAYMTLPFLILATCQLFSGDLKTRGRIVLLAAAAVTSSLLLHAVTYHRTVALRAPSNGWFCVYGMLNGGTWWDGFTHSQDLLQNPPKLAPSNRGGRIFQFAAAGLQPDRMQALQLLKHECLSEIRHHPVKLMNGWWRALQFFWSRNAPFVATGAANPSLWFTEFACWSAVLGVAVSLFLLFRGTGVAPEFKTYQAVSWLNLAALLGILASLPFAPPWDTGTRTLAATLPLFFLLPASGVGGLYLLIVNRIHHATRKPSANENIAVGSAVAIGATLSFVIFSASWWLPSTSSVSKNGPHPVKLMLDELTGEAPLVSSIDLRSLNAGYHLRLTDNSQPTWLPNISAKNFVLNAPRIAGYETFSEAMNKLPPGTEIVVLPYWTLLVVSKDDAEANRFTPRPEQMGHVVWPRLYFSKQLNVPPQKVEAPTEAGPP